MLLLEKETALLRSRYQISAALSRRLEDVCCFLTTESQAVKARSQMDGVRSVSGNFLTFHDHSADSQGIHLCSSTFSTSAFKIECILYLCLETVIVIELMVAWLVAFCLVSIASKANLLKFLSVPLS